MHKIMVVPLAGLLALTVAAPAMAGPNVSNTSNSLTMAQGSWDSWDDATQTYGFGYITVSQDQSGNTFAEYSASSQQYVQCTGADTPDDPSDDTFGTIGTDDYGWGSATLATAKTYSTANASGTLDIGRVSYDECTGIYDKEQVSSATFSLDLTATSALIKESGRGSFHIPGTFNNHSSYKAAYRYAEGTFDAGNGAVDVYGAIGKVTSSDHTNG
ncbi:MAG TPA: hypothetical protein VNM34_09545 [Verrucomicrobiae bacterium]|nr:hypothetical protein [Verrucomicrobiae bacterium]